MNSLTKLLLASAVVASFAAPALAYDYNSEGFPLQVRNETFVQQPVQSQDWTGAYAMDRSAGGAYAYDRGATTVDGSSTAGRGAEAINGGN